MGRKLRIASHSSSEAIALVRIRSRFFGNDFVVFVILRGHWVLISMMALSKYKPRRFVGIGMRVWDFVVQIK